MLTQTNVMKGLKILAVDDYPEMTSLVDDILSDTGASVVAANTGPDAIRLLMSTRFDLLILDVGMPQPDGLKILEFLKTTNPGLLRRTLVLTGMQYHNKTMGTLVRLGIPFLLKPFRIEELVDEAWRLTHPRALYERTCK